MDGHPLDDVARFALTGPQARFAIRHGNALRFDPVVGVFAAVADGSDASLADLGELIAQHGDVAFLGPNPPTGAPGVVVASQNQGVQMVAHDVQSPRGHVQVVTLGDADAPEMLELAGLTQPGPFFARTHQLGHFVGVREQGRLVAMAGERMKPEGFTEVSGVCTHPEWRGRGLAAELTRVVARQILDRGETPFLHAHASNTGAISLYRELGFTLRREVLMTRLTRAEAT